jgi:hypothetical protein
MQAFLEALRTQRWDDHRYYHHSRINQTLHLVSAISFLFSYVMIFKDPAISALAGWLVAMTTRQTGHFFFEPKDYDVVNKATHEYKEEIKVGYNLRRKVVLLTIWALSPLPLYFDPTYLARARHRRRPVSNRAAVLGQRRPDRSGVGDQNPHRSVSRHQDLPQGAACAFTRRADRSGYRPASLG